MKILIVCGSTAKKSHTRGMLHYCEKLLIEKGAEVIFWDLLTQPLSIAIPELHENPMDTPNENVKEFNRAVKSADAFLLGSPLYHGSYSGALKNALDNLPGDAFRNKPVGLISSAGGARNAAHACEHLRLVVRALYGYVLQSQIGTGSEDYEDSEDGFELVSQDIKGRAERLVQELIKFATVLKEHPVNL